MEEISFKEFLQKSGQMLEKYRSNLEHITKIRAQIEKQFFTPEEMIEFFHQNKSEYYTWQATQDSILALEDAFNDLVTNMLDAINNPKGYQFFLRDQRIPVMTQVEEEDESENKSKKEEEK
ncbi:MAG: hypothetical protein ACTSX6_10150 [Candidatus Heimdallarchaeaceae archaeon]